MFVFNEIKARQAKPLRRFFAWLAANELHGSVEDALFARQVIRINGKAGNRRQVLLHEEWAGAEPGS